MVSWVSLPLSFTEVPFSALILLKLTMMYFPLFIIPYRFSFHLYVIGLNETDMFSTLSCNKTVEIGQFLISFK